MTVREPRRGLVLSVFSGAGGLDLGLEYAGFDPILCLDTDSAARATLRLNRPQWQVPEDGDVLGAAERWRPQDLGVAVGELDLVVGGPPCQPFSKAAQWVATGRTGLKDPRAVPLHSMLRLVEAFLPRAILIENVPGFLSGPASALRSLQLRLAAINRRCGTTYRIRHRIVNAADYGVPQHRRRAILVAFRDGRDYRLPTVTHRDTPMTTWDALHDYAEPSPPAPRGTWTGLLAAIPEGANYQWLTAKGGGPEIFGWRTRYWSFLLKLARDRPAWTLPASPGPNTGPFHWDNRPLSTRERLRLQSFPDAWQLTGTTRGQYRMAGNATPPLLAEVVGRTLATEVGLQPHIDAAAAPRLLIERAVDVPLVAPIGLVPDRFLIHVGPKLAHPGTGLGPAPRNADGTASEGEAA